MSLVHSTCKGPAQSALRGGVDIRRPKVLKRFLRSASCGTWLRELQYLIGMSALSDIAYGYRYPEISRSSSLHPCGFSPRMYITFVVVDQYPFRPIPRGLQTLHVRLSIWTEHLLRQSATSSLACTTSPPSPSPERYSEAQAPLMPPPRALSCPASLHHHPRSRACSLSTTVFPTPSSRTVSGCSRPRRLCTARARAVPEQVTVGLRRRRPDPLRASRSGTDAPGARGTLGAREAPCCQYHVPDRLMHLSQLSLTSSSRYSRAVCHGLFGIYTRPRDPTHVHVRA